MSKEIDLKIHNVILTESENDANLFLTKYNDLTSYWKTLSIVIKKSKNDLILVIKYHSKNAVMGFQRFP